MKLTKLILLALTGLIVSGFPLWGQSRATGLLKTTPRLQQASPQAVMSRLNLRSEDLPSRVDLATGVLLARSQGNIGSCGSYSTSNTLTVMLRRRDNLPISNRSFFSASFLYSQVMIGNDEGSTLPDNLELARTTGVATIITFPYTENTTIKPGVHAFREANRFRLSEYRWIQHDDVDTFRLFLSQGYPVIIALRVYDDIFSYRGGIYNPTGLPSQNNHAVTVYAYNDAERTFSAKGSWGEQWGESGSFRFSYETLNNSSLVREAYIAVLADSNPAAPLFPARVEASKGIYRDRTRIQWQPAENALEYEVFRLDSVRPADPREEQYVSLGVTSDTFFEDRTAIPERSYFYLVRTHTRDVSSDLSFPAEGWASSAARNVPPGPPSGFHAVQQGSTVLLRWDKVDDADHYSVYTWRRSDWFKVGQTATTSFVDTRPAREEKTTIYFVVAENQYGQSMASNTSSVQFDGSNDDSVPDEGGIERYNGRFYTFPQERFRQAERIFRANFLRHAATFEERFRAERQRLFNRGGQR